MANEQRPIIVKRIKKIEGGHHGGAWKVAYADFVTAMMAFFLLLWLLSAVTEEQKKGIANYFRPTLAVSTTAATVNILQGETQPMDNMSGGPAVAIEPEADANAAVVDADDPAVSETPEPVDTGGARPLDITEAQAAVAREEERRFAEVKQRIEQAIEATPDLRELKQNLLIEQTDEGLRIQLLDREKVSMFPSGSAVMNEKSRRLLEKVAQAIGTLPNKLSISGHTDATPYLGSGDYSNWELSTDRANASRRVLSQAGIAPGRVETINGKAETDPLVRNDPFAPQNRRISIVLLREKRPVRSSAEPATAPVSPARQSGPPPELIPPEQAGQ